MAPSKSRPYSHSFLSLLSIAKTSPTHDVSRVGPRFQAILPPCQAGSADRDEEGFGLEMWSDVHVPPGFDVDAFMDKVFYDFLQRLFDALLLPPC